MNERIVQLIEQCTTQQFSDCIGGYETFDKEKFAELIVLECTNHITNQQDLVETNWQCKDGIHIVYSLKEHFGVE